MARRPTQKRLYAGPRWPCTCVVSCPYATQRATSHSNTLVAHWSITGPSSAAHIAVWHGCAGYRQHLNKVAFTLPGGPQRLAKLSPPLRCAASIYLFTTPPPKKFTWQIFLTLGRTWAHPCTRVFFGLKAFKKHRNFRAPAHAHHTIFRNMASYSHLCSYSMAP